MLGVEATPILAVQLQLIEVEMLYSTDRHLQLRRGEQRQHALANKKAETACKSTELQQVVASTILMAVGMYTPRHAHATPIHTACICHGMSTPWHVHGMCMCTPQHAHAVTSKCACHGTSTVGY